LKAYQRNNQGFYLLSSGTSVLDAESSGSLLKSPVQALAEFIQHMDDLSNEVNEQNLQLDFTRVAMLSGLGHDPMLRDIFIPLALGSQLLIPDESIYQDSEALFLWLQQQAVTHIHATPSLMALMLNGNVQHEENLTLKSAFI